MPTIRDIQLVELDLLKEIDRICRATNTGYCMAWGTMLGAVRHKGFIPWDDDIDIYMLKTDIDTIDKNLDKNLFFLQTNVTDPECNFAFVKLRRNNTIMPERELKNLHIHNGIWLDVFCLYPAASTKMGRQLQYLISEALIRCRGRFLNSRNNPRLLLYKALSLLPLKVYRGVDNFLEYAISSLGSNSSDLYFCPCNKSYARSFIKKQFFDKRSDYIFEEFSFSGVADYHSYLTFLYGQDYMTPIQYGHNVDYESVVLNTDAKK